MKHSDPNDPVSRILADWQVNPKADANFRPTVWSRIRRGTPSSWTGYVRAHRLTWSVTAAVAMMAAGWTGHSVAQVKLANEREQMVVAYLGGLDPRVIANLRP
jgi:hypothetical protein